MGEPDSQAAIKAGDWFAQVEVIMGDLSEGSGEWWALIMKCARETYDRWSTSTALERLSIYPEIPESLRNPRFSRLESRAFSMLQAAIPASVLDELLASRQLTCVHAVYQILKSFQPGGLAERTRLLEALQNPGAGQSAKDILERLRVWSRHLSRAVTMGISVPDASILLKGLDSLCSGMLVKLPQVDFRMSVARTKLALDHAPTQDHVSEFAKALQSEFAMLALASTDDGKGPKNPKAAKLEGAEKAAGKGQGAKGGTGKGFPRVSLKRRGVSTGSRRTAAPMLIDASLLTILRYLGEWALFPVFGYWAYQTRVSS